MSLKTLKPTKTPLWATKKTRVPGVKSVPHNYPWLKDTLQFLTLTFDERHHKKSLETLWISSMYDVLRKLRQISPNFFKVFSEMTERGILHYHIICKHYNFVSMKYFRGWWARKYGWTDLQKIGNKVSKNGANLDYLNCFNYCRKESLEMMNDYLPTSRLKTMYAKIFCSIPSNNNVRNFFEFGGDVLEARKYKQIVTKKEQEFNSFLKKLLLPSEKGPHAPSSLTSGETMGSGESPTFYCCSPANPNRH